MANAVQTPLTVFKYGTATLMARVENSAGTAINQASVSSAKYSAWLLDADWPDDPDTRTAITGHSDVALTVASCVFDTNQTGSNWTVDSTGYNFRHEIDVGTNHIFSTAGRYVLIKVTITPASGQVIVFDYVARVL